MSEQLLPPRFLFRLSAPCRPTDKLWSDAGPKLGDEHRLPAFCELDGQEPFADVRAGWSDAGLAFSIRISGKRLPTRCDLGRPTECDGVELFLDTRDTHNVHRASRFCHRFVAIPFGAGGRREDPHVEQLIVHRAKEDARQAPSRSLQVRSERRVDGYVMEVLIPAAALTGFGPAEHPRLGFTYLVRDHSLGRQIFSCPDGFPFDTDPSLWGTLELVKS